MCDSATFKIPAGCRITAYKGKIFLRVLGENEDPGVKEALLAIADFHRDLSTQGIAHETQKRTGDDELGEYVVDCISFATLK